MLNVASVVLAVQVAERAVGGCPVGQTNALRLAAGLIKIVSKAAATTASIFLENNHRRLNGLITCLPVRVAIYRSVLAASSTLWANNIRQTINCIANQLKNIPFFT